MKIFVVMVRSNGNFLSSASTCSDISLLNNVEIISHQRLITSIYIADITAKCGDITCTL